MHTLVMNCKDEDNIVEWVLYHALIGFDRIVIFDDMSATPVEGVLRGSRLIVLMCEYLGVSLDIRRVHMIKTRYMNTALNEARADPSCEWFMSLDADEYLMIPCDIRSFLRTVASEETVGVGFWWRRFGSSGLIDNPRPEQCVSVFRRCEPFLATKLKTIVRPSRVGIALSPHHYSMRPPNTLIDAATGAPIPNLPDQDHSNTRTDVYIAHYINQDWRKFCMRRSRPRDDTGGMRRFGFVLDPASDPPDEFTSMFNEVSCDDVFRRYREMIDDVIGRLSHPPV